MCVNSSSSTNAQGILGIVERLRLGSSKRLTVNVLRNQPAISLAGQQRNRRTLDETNLASRLVRKYVFSQFARPPQWSATEGVGA
jgi:hypothetical protein